MAFWKTTVHNSTGMGDNYVTLPSSTAAGGSFNEFYELEPGVVLDIILDSSHVIFNDGKEIANQPWASDLAGEIPSPTDVDFTWIGRALIRLVNSHRKMEKERLIWAIPLESNVSEYPLVNETVIVGKYLGKYYYSRKLNTTNLVNHNVDFSMEPYLGNGPNQELYETTPYQGPLSSTTHQADIEQQGVAGRYFWINKNIRAIKRHEGDTIIESRFGQSIKFGAYDDDRRNDVGSQTNKDYDGQQNGAPINTWADAASGGGNPMILIRNRQRPLLVNGKELSLQNSDNPATIKGTEEEKNVGGYISEDINHDGSSIHITSGQTVTKWVTTCYKRMFGDEKGEEVPAFKGKSTFKYPKLNGDQIVINSDRLIFSARYGETFSYSKKRHGIVTDSEFTVDAHDQIVMTTHVKTVFNSPAIYLGEYDNTSEPALLGQTTINWLYELCNWLLAHNHWYIHSHPKTGGPSPEKTQLPVQIQKLKELRDSLHALLSRRVFVTGGGFAPGSDGVTI